MFMSTIKTPSRLEYAVETLSQWMRQGRLPAGGRLPPENDLALELKISRGTVRRALQMLEEKAMIKQSSPSATRIVCHRAESRTGIMGESIALLSDLAETPAHAEEAVSTDRLEYYLKREVERRGLHLLRLNQRTVFSQGVHQLLQNPPLGVVVTYRVSELPEAARVLDLLRQNSVPVVINTDEERFKSYNTVTSDQEGGAYALTRYLIEHGRSRIVQFWSSPIDHDWKKARARGYERAMGEAGLAFQPPVVLARGVIGGGEGLSGRERFEYMSRLIAGYLADRMSSTEPPDALMMQSDFWTSRAVLACRMLGRKPHEDVAIAGYDFFAQILPEAQWEPLLPLVTVDKKYDEAAEKIVDLLLEADVHNFEAGSKHIKVGHKIVEFDSAQFSINTQGASL